MLDRVADFQVENTETVLIAALLLTVFLASGIPKIELQTDFQDSLPDDLPPIQAQEEIEARFGSSEAVIILFQLEKESAESSYPKDIRSPKVIRTMEYLEQDLEKESIVDSTSSMASVFNRTPDSTEASIRQLERSRVSFTNRDYTASTMFVEINEEPTEENVREMTSTVRTSVEQAPKYPGVDITVTGMPVVRNTISDVLVSDTVSTIALASALILALLMIVRGLYYGPITFVPLFAGLTWTLGAMGHMGIPLNFATISLGSMILGLGVEYGSFISERIIEETNGGTVEDAVRTAVPNTGSAILGSATTDGVGFLALLLASISFIRDLGLTLALGEFLTVGSALLVTPALLLFYERRIKND